MDEHSLDDFTRDLTTLINRYSLEQESNTPDFILAMFLTKCLFAYCTTAKDDKKWNSNFIL